MEKIFYRHLRIHNDAGEVKPKGGQTIGWMRDLENDRILITRAICSKDDHYNREVGRRYVDERMVLAKELSNEFINETKGEGSIISFVTGDGIRSAAQFVMDNICELPLPFEQTLEHFSNKFIEYCIFGASVK